MCTEISKLYSTIINSKFDIYWLYLKSKIENFPGKGKMLKYFKCKKKKRKIKKQ